MNKKIMILGAGILQLPGIQQAKQMGLQVVAVDMNPFAAGFKETGIEKEVISTIDIPAVIQAAEKHKIDGLMTIASDMPMRTVAAVSKKLGLIGISEDTALKATNKVEMRQCLRDHNVPIPDFYKVSNINEYMHAIQRFRGAFVVKPADNCGSRGIYFVPNKRDRKTVLKAYTYSHLYSHCGDVVVEEYMNGPEVSVETLTIDGMCHVIQITDKLTTGVPHFVEMGHSQPADFSHEMAEQIRNIAGAANKAIGILNGPSHTEIIITDEGPKIVELGARLGGDCITTHLVPLSTGVNMVECCIQIILGNKPDITQKYNQGSAIRYFPQKAGTIRNIYGVENAYRIDGIQQVSFVKDIGVKITEIDNSAARMGFVISNADNAKNAIAACERVMDLVKIKIK